MKKQAQAARSRGAGRLQQQVLHKALGKPVLLVQTQQDQAAKQLHDSGSVQ